MRSALLALCVAAVACSTTSATAPPPAEQPASVPPLPDDMGHAEALGEKGSKPTTNKVLPEPAPDTRARIGAIGPHTWIWKKTSRDGLAIGRMRNGTSAVLKSTTGVEGPDCKGKWYAIEPRGFVCADNTTTLDLNNEYYKALAFGAPKPGTWPYRYAHSNGSPMYSRVPTPEEWAASERGMGPVNSWKPLGEWAKGHEENIVDEPIKATDPVPYYLKDGKRTAPGGNYHTGVLVWKKMPAGSMLAYSHAFEMYGRVWLLTPDTMVVPADRMSDMKRTSFRGVLFSESELTMPLLWNKSKTPMAKLERTDDGSFRETSETIPAKSPVEVTAEPIRKDNALYYALRAEPNRFIKKSLEPAKLLDDNVSVVERATAIPRGVAADEKWLQARIIPGTLTAYVGLEPVMTTMFSPGKGGPPLKTFKFPDDHSKYATTAVGLFPMEWKERAHTMSNEKGEPKVLWFTDVPFQQYLKAPLAMHVTYWHEDFGKRKSAECLNVAPEDGAWLFDWTLPVLPEGWGGVGAGQGNGKSTPVHVTVN